MNTDKKPRVGVGVVVIKDNKVLLHKRRGSHGDGSWSFPGGHLSFGESAEDCAKREAMEEANITIKNIKLGSFTEDLFKKEDKHYITLFVIAEYDSGEVKIMESEKCEEWKWFEWYNLPEPLFTPIQNLLKEYNPFR